MPMREDKQQNYGISQAKNHKMSEDGFQHATITLEGIPDTGNQTETKSSMQSEDCNTALRPMTLGLITTEPWTEQTGSKTLTQINTGLTLEAKLEQDSYSWKKQLKLSKQ